MAQTLPSGIEKFDPTDTVSRTAFNENWETIDGHLAGATSAATASTIAKRDAAGRMKVAAPAAADDVARKAEIDAPPFTTTTGTGAAYVATFSPAYSALVAGTRITVKFHVANTGAATINVNGLGAKSILRSGGAALTAGIIKLNAVMSLVYDGTNFILQGEGGNGNATAADLLSGKTASVDTGDIVGTMPNRTGHVTGQSISRSGTTLRIRPQEGKYPGDAANSVQWSDPNWLAENIREGISLFGLVGALVEGKKWASGTAVSSSVVVNYVTESGSNNSLRTVQVSGIDFLPSVIILLNNVPAPDNNSSVTLYTADRVGVNSNILATGGYSSSLFNFYRLQSPASVSASGFSLPVQNASRTYSWLAIE